MFQTWFRNNIWKLNLCYWNLDFFYKKLNFIVFYLKFGFQAKTFSKVGAWVCKREFKLWPKRILFAHIYKFWPEYKRSVKRLANKRGIQGWRRPNDLRRNWWVVELSWLPVAFAWLGKVLVTCMITKSWCGNIRNVFRGNACCHRVWLTFVQNVGWSRGWKNVAPILSFNIESSIIAAVKLKQGPDRKISTNLYFFLFEWFSEIPPAVSMPLEI